jgi:polysaccharide export outer membrane protein
MKIFPLFMAMTLFLGQVPAMCLELPAAPEKERFIGSGDVINISVFPAEEFSREVTVQPDGTIEIPLLGSLKVQGQTQDDLQKLLISRFSKYVSNPSITLNVRKFSDSQVSIIGQVMTPGQYEYREGMRLLDLVASARGPQDYAKMNTVRVYRRGKGPGAGHELVFKTDLAAVFDGKLDKNIPLSTGDIVYVPRKGYSTGARWITDNMVPWLTLFTFMVTASIVARKN